MAAPLLVSLAPNNKTLTVSEATYTGAFTVTSSNPAVAVVLPPSQNGPGPVLFAIVGLQTGTVNLTVSDSFGQQVVVQGVPVVPTPGTLTLSPSTLSFADAQEAPQPCIVSGGTGPYTAQSASPAIATAQIAGAVILITPQSAGATTIVVMDANALVALLTITVAYTIPSMEEVFVQYLGSQASSAPNVFFSDLQIQESYPGVEFNPQEVGGVWQEIREVTGDQWFVTNATWSPTAAAWGFVNANLNAYALRLSQSTGATTRYVCAAGTAPFAWTAIFAVNGDGSISIAPGSIFTSPAEIAEQISPVWNATGATVMTARKVNVTDDASASASLLDQLAVNGVDKWDVDKSGTLVTGIIPTARLSGNLPPSAFGLQADSFGPATIGVPLAVVFAPAYATALTALVCGISAGAGDLSAYSLHTDSETKTGFNVTVTGGAPGTTVNGYYISIGS